MNQSKSTPNAIIIQSADQSFRLFDNREIYLHGGLWFQDKSLVVVRTG